MKKSLNKIVENIFWIVITLLIFQMQVFPSKYTTEVYMCVILIGIAWIIMNRCIVHYNIYFISFGFLIINIFFHIFLTPETGSVTRFILVFAQYLVLILIYNFLVYKTNFEKFLKIYVNITVLSLGTIYLLLGDRVLSSRLGHNGSGSIVSYYLFGQPIYKSSNSTATLCCIAIFICLYYIIRKKRKTYIIKLIFLCSGVILSGSRKGLLFLGIIILYSTFIMKKGRALRKLALVFILPVLFYLLCFKVPIIYDLIGDRLESLLLNILGQTNVEDGNSFNMRMLLAEKAKLYFHKKPIFGWGLSVFTNNNGGYGPENNYLDLMVSSGLIGLISYYTYAAFAINKILNRFFENDELFRIFSVILIVLLIMDLGSVSYCWLSTTLWITCFFVTLHKNKENLKSKQYN